MTQDTIDRYVRRALMRQGWRPAATRETALPFEHIQAMAARYADEALAPEAEAAPVHRA